ncbi:MAG TPA: hypothetical protein VFW20_01855, partial [Candidatus Limnocylindrales bacterium]|nr:hypothetical protein [Candidatus Limnocylindrales bacterium]
MPDHSAHHGERELLARTATLATEFLETVDDRPVAPPVGPDGLRERLGGELPDRGEPPERVIEWLAHAVEPGLVASAGPRYFGFVMGGSQP